jgi:radical SAM superfamily enzyme YgiQ (UPF0313 family)
MVISMIQYDEPVIRPPSEADSLILQATLGCSHNRCAFCVTYQTKRYRQRPEQGLMAEIDWAARIKPAVRKVFLGDGDALSLSTDRLLRILAHLKKRLPALRRTAAYARPANFRRKSVEELQALRRAGLQFLYVGLESGEDEILRRIEKGVTADEMAHLCAKPHEAGIKLFVTVVLGLGGPSLSDRHARATAALLDRIKPRFAAALSLMLPPRQPTYAEAFGDPGWRLLAPDEFLIETRNLVDAIRSNGIIFYTNHASNYVPVQGTLQKDKQKMLDKLDRAIEDPNRLRPDYLRGL